MSEPSQKTNEEIFAEAREKIVRLANTRDVQQFLAACALNVISMEQQGDDPEMIFKLQGREFKFTG